jgi:predicted permease
MPDYFAAMRIPLRRGRLLDARDDQRSPAAVLINEGFAKRKFPNGDAIGRRVHIGTDDGTWYAIVGIVGDVKQASLSIGDPDAFYVTPQQWHWADNAMSLVVRTRGDAAALAPALRAAIWSLDKDQPILRIATMRQLVARSEANRHFALVLFEIFGVVALALAATGIYGVLSGGVTERLRELGVRSALGASPGSIVALVLRQGLSLTGAGIVIGMAGAALTTRAISSMLFGISRIDPLTYAGVIALLLAVSALACWLPALRASRVDPSTTLRTD